MTAIVPRGNAADLHLPDETVDLIVTSPPYFGLRSYQDGGEHYAGQVGDEATPTEYLDALLNCTAEWMRVLKPGGSIFVNLGDKYAGGGMGGHSAGLVGTKPQGEGNAYRKVRQDVPTKSLTALPWRYAIRCIDELGLILRAEIVWAKPNGLPESVTDRVRRSHEQVFHFVKQPRYFSAVDEVREPSSDYARPSTADRGRRGGSKARTFTDSVNPLGKLPGSAWEIATAPLAAPLWRGVERGRIVRYFSGSEAKARAEADTWLRRGGAARRSVRRMADHFAAYPPELVRRIVLGWSPRDVCTACGEGRRPVAERAVVNTNERLALRTVARAAGTGGTARSTLGRGADEAGRTITGYACACPDTDAPATPGVVLDPFGGTGTTALVASTFGRVGISVDLSADYCRLARWRTTDPGERARVLKVDKPPVQVDGQLGMFEGIGA